MSQMAARHVPAPARRAIAALAVAMIPLLFFGGTQPKTAHAAAAYTYWFPWYDLASPGMQVDNIHVVNPTGATANVTISMPGASNIGGAIPAYSERYYAWPGTIGGPVQITADLPVIVTQRVTYGLSFNEFPALSGSSAGKSFWFPWYDKASPGVLNDNIHLVNPGAVDANVTATLGQGNFTFQIPVKAGTATYHSFPSGQIGGPVHITSDQPILVSQRVQFNSSFNEIAGLADSAASTFNVINWYDNASPGYYGDDIHIVNPDTAQTASVTLHYPGHSDVVKTVAPRSDVYQNYPGTIGGPITMISNIGVIVTQRVNYWGSFKEYRALTPSDGTKDAWFNWYDNASPCMLQNNIHLFTTGHSRGTIYLGEPGMLMPFDVTGEGYFSFPLGTIGGPLHIVVADGYAPVYPELRTVRCPPPPPPAPKPPVPLPTRLRMPGLYWPSNNMAVESVGLDSNGDMGVPSNVYDAAWFNQMPRPGDNGDAVMTGHKDWWTTSCAAFCYLTSVWVGMDIYVDREDGSTVHFVVDGYNYYPADAPPSWLYTTSGGAQLSLITCAGDFVGTHYTDRFVVHSHQV